jgi:hypothetical protein
MVHVAPRRLYMNIRCMHIYVVPVAQAGGTQVPLHQHSAHGEPATSVSGAHGVLSPRHQHSTPINSAGHAVPALDQAGVDPATAATIDAPGSATVSQVHEQQRPVTRLQKGIQKPKVVQMIQFDGVILYPQNLLRYVMLYLMLIGN